METLEQKYLKLLEEYDKLKAERQKLSQDNRLQNCNEAYKRSSQVRVELVKNIKDLYGSWLPPKVKSFFTTMRDWAKSGFKKAEFADKRYSICQGCEYFSEPRCNLCGCYMKGKTSVAKASCPILKWKAEDEKEEKQTD
tara:strand:- start:125 stop:541 length:417 start_codon:yes stop_codon:yes gene_type:complete